MEEKLSRIEIKRDVIYNGMTICKLLKGDFLHYQLKEFSIDCNFLDLNWGKFLYKNNFYDYLVQKKNDYTTLNDNIILVKDPYTLYTAFKCLKKIDQFSGLVYSPGFFETITTLEFLGMVKNSRVCVEDYIKFSKDFPNDRTRIVCEIFFKREN